MKYGMFTALVLALNLVFDGVAFAGHNNDIEINSDRNFANTETITSDKRTIIGSGVTITIAPDAELRLVNNNTTNDQASVVETGLTGASDIAFNGGKLILRREGDGVIIRANGGTTSALTFTNQIKLYVQPLSWIQYNPMDVGDNDCCVHRSKVPLSNGGKNLPP